MFVGSDEVFVIRITQFWHGYQCCIYGVLTGGILLQKCALKLMFYNIFTCNFPITRLYCLQINFFQDHTKVILCPLMQCVTYIDEHRNFRTFRFELIEKHGCSKELASRLRYARTMVERLIQSKSSSGRVKSASSTASSAQQQPPSTTQQPTHNAFAP